MMKGGATLTPGRYPRLRHLCVSISLCLAWAGSCGAAHASSAASGPAALDSAAGLSANPGAIAGGAGPSGADADADVSFNSRFLVGSAGEHADLRPFERATDIPPGVYSVDVYLNDQWVARKDLRFVLPQGHGRAVACLDPGLVASWNLKPAIEKDLLAHLKASGGCLRLEQVVPGASLRMDMSRLRADVSFPQIDMNLHARGYVAPENWDKGITAGLVSYNFNAYRSTSGGQSQTDAYLGLNTGINLGAWHVRESGSLMWQSASRGTAARVHWQSVNTYAQRDIPAWRAQLTVGDSYTDGQVFSSFGVRGVQITTDDRMRPQSEQGYAPVIRGVAQTNARVTVRQNGIQIYETTVSPGPFVINDLYPTGYGGDLQVTVTEANGQVSTFSVPYAALPQLLRPGQSRFSVAAGQLRSTGLHHAPGVVSAAVQRGMSNWVTSYLGAQASTGFGAVVAGSAFNTPIGAVSADVTESYARIPGQPSRSGQSYRLTYSKFITATRTTVSMAAYRYSTGGYLTLNDAAIARDYARRNIDPFSTLAPYNPLVNGVPFQSLLSPLQQAALSGRSPQSLVQQYLLQRRRDQFSLNISQNLGPAAGSLYATVASTEYWNHQNADTSYQLGYSNGWKRLHYALSASRVRMPDGHYNNEYFVSLTLPLGTGSHVPMASLNFNHLDGSGTVEQGNLSGTFGDHDQFSYGVAGSHQPNGGGSSGSVNAGYRSPIALFNASYGQGSGYSQSSVGASGALVVHGGGVVFGQMLGDTIGIVHAPGAHGAQITSSIGSVVNKAGYALVPYLMPYQMNRVELDPKGTSLGTQINGTVASVAPDAGAVVMLEFKTSQGHVLMLHARLPNGENLPFGADIMTDHGATVGFVGQGGRVLVRVADPGQALQARWTDDHNQEQTCPLIFAWPKAGGEHARGLYTEVAATCAPRPDSLGSVVQPSVKAGASRRVVDSAHSERSR